MNAIHINNGNRPKSDAEMIRVVSQKLLDLTDTAPGSVQRDLERIAQRLEKDDQMTTPTTGAVAEYKMAAQAWRETLDIEPNRVLAGLILKTVECADAAIAEQAAEIERLKAELADVHAAGVQDGLKKAVNELKCMTSTSQSDVENNISYRAFKSAAQTIRKYFNLDGKGGA